ncbi:protein KTI12 homolog [Saccoglossus kowalevskii]|uniref:Protein KTI12 homolog n=1 Tax=Saccoglossus kowalevskii TaxID=10224 RepID=A0ABM0LW24_SACKO|nr:PREDICTED: protein KTI12 homolog [Saccoglossus kowalevskii]
MPLVLMCGLPCSGKTKRAEELKKYIEVNKAKDVHIVSDHSIGVDRNYVYADSRREKDIRGTLKANVERKINKDDVVILDSLNYIKGCRYEFYCVSKSAKTTHCVIHCELAVDTASAWNKEREKTEQYSQEIFDALVMRFEAPDSRNRWDSPLFTILPDSDVPCEAICDAIFDRKAPPPNFSTQSQPLSSTNFLYELDKITQDVITVLLEAQKTSVPGDQISIPDAKDKINLIHNYNVSELRRHRRQFISYTKTHPVNNTRLIANMFVQYLNNSVQ